MTRTQQRRRQTWRFRALNMANKLFGAIVILAIVLILIQVTTQKEPEYLKMLNENTKYWSEVLSIIHDKEEAKTEAETSRAKIKELKEEALESSARSAQLLTETEEMEKESKAKIDNFVPEEEEQLFLQANSNAELADAESRDALERIKEMEEEIEEIKKASESATSITTYAQERKLLFSTSIDEEILLMLQESEEALVVAKESSANLDQIVEEVTYLASLTKEHWEDAKNFDVVQAIEELPKNERNDVLLLAECIYHEAGICDEAEQYRVATVVMNRIVSEYYPETVYGVIYDTKYAQQYGSTGRFFTCTLPEKAYIVAYDVYINKARNLPENIIGQTGFKPSTSKYDIYMVSDWGHYYFSIK